MRRFVPRHLLVVLVVVAVAAVTASGATTSGAAAAPRGPVASAASAARDATYGIPPIDRSTIRDELGLSQSDLKRIAASWNLQANAANTASAYLQLIAIGSAPFTFGIGTEVAEAMSGLAGAYGTALGIGATVLNWLSEDPVPSKEATQWLSRDSAQAIGPDGSFRALFKPGFAPVPAVKMPARFAAAGVALHKYESSEARLAVLATAYAASVNRAADARRAHAGEWARRQEHAAAKWARRAANVLLGLQREREAVVSAVHVHVTVSAHQVAAARQKLSARSLRRATVKTVDNLTKGTVAPSLKQMMLRNASASLTSSAPSGAIQFPAGLRAPPSVVSQEHQVAKALLGYAKRF